MPLIERIVKFNSAHRFLSHVIFWLIVSLFYFNRYEIREYSNFSVILIRHTYYMSFAIMSSYFVTYLIIPKLIGAKKYYLIIIYFLAGSYLISVLSRTVIVHIVEPLIRERPFSQESILEIMTDVSKLFRHYFILNFSTSWVFAFVKLIKDQYVIQKHQLSLEKEKAETELKVLKAQLNPHFLFNTLNNIYSLSLTNSPVTSKSIAGLSEILDHVLYRCNDVYVPLSAEIALINNYLELEKLRYDDRLQVKFIYSIDKDALIAPLILLSLVENAFKHGVVEDTGVPVVDIDLNLKDDYFRFRVSNSFVAIDEYTENDRIGLNNVTKQLQLIYPGRYEFNTSTANNIFVALLQIDLQGIQSKENQVYEGKMSFS